MMRHITFVVDKATGVVHSGANKANSSYGNFLKKHKLYESKEVTFLAQDSDGNPVYENGAQVSSTKVIDVELPYESQPNEFVDVSTDDERYTNPDNLKYVDGAIVVDEKKMADQLYLANLSVLKQNRDVSLQNNVAIYNGFSFNARPSDLSNFQLGIDKNDVLWPDVNDIMVDVTSDDLQAIMNIGIAQGEAIWDEYKQAVKALQS